MVQPQVDGSVQFELFLPEAEIVKLAGTFTDWENRAIAMRGPEEGWWILKLHLPPGDYEFQYIVDDNIWLADYAAHGVRRNECGTWVSLLTVPQQNTGIREAISVNAA
ncbi:MAG TPA: glycoside hydrolase family 13 [Phycisphaeraceae bacterium]|nr:glycoside hydrolase family 13 [Phycisphaeraceae bacterium]